MITKVSCRHLWLLYVFIVIIGTATVVSQKILLEQSGNGRSIYENPHRFSKPLFQTNTMLLAMCFAFIVHMIQKCCLKGDDAQRSLETVGASRLMDEKTSWKPYFYVIFLGIFDLLAIVFMNIGLLYLQPSTWQMLKGSIIIFMTLMNIMTKKPQNYAFMWWSVLIVFVALVVVSVAAVLSSDVTNNVETRRKVIIAILLTLCSQLFQAIRYAIGTVLSEDFAMPPFLSMGLEGVYGLILSFAVFFPIAQFVGNHKDEGNGINEDIIDTFKMIGNSGTILMWVILFLCFVMFYFFSDTYIKNISRNKARTIIEGVRIMCIWLTQLLIYYIGHGTNFGKKHSTMGENWTAWSWMQLAGFLLLLTGTLLYEKIIRIPIFAYPVEKMEQDVDFTLPIKNNIDDTPLFEKQD